MAESNPNLIPINRRVNKRVTVPEIYRKAAKILKSADDKRDSVKNLIYSSGYRDIKPIYALLAECLKHQALIEDLINSSGLRDEQPVVDPHLARILITELLWGKGYLKPENARPIKTILNFESNLRDALKKKDYNPVDEIQVPRYVRVNTLVCSVGDAIQLLVDEGWVKVTLKKKTDYTAFLEKVKNLGESEFIVDYHLEFLLVFPPKTQFHDHYLLQNGSLFLQDKASCMSAVALTNTFDGSVLDACSAPGMKTSLLAALSNDQGRIIAIERDYRRCNVLRKTIESSGATNVEVLCQDFLKIDPSKYQDVKYILLDPSCSGSGIVKRLESIGKSKEDDNLKFRLRKLNRLQCMLLEHAALFPNVQRIVYSTCSIHAEENESVVGQTLGKIGHLFKLEKALPFWHRRGIDDFDSNHDIGVNCVRSDAKEDLTNGFFIALFARRELT